MNVTKFTYEPGCDLAAGWDGAHLDGRHCSGHDMRVTVSRCMYDPKFVRFQANVDGSTHIDGVVDHPVERNGLDAELAAIWEKCANTPSVYRTAQI